MLIKRRAKTVLISSPKTHPHPCTLENHGHGHTPAVLSSLAKQRDNNPPLGAGAAKHAAKPEAQIPRAQRRGGGS